MDEIANVEQRSGGLTRREALQRGGVVVGAAALWTTPIVQTLGQRPAAASTHPTFLSCERVLEVAYEYSYTGTESADLWECIDVRVVRNTPPGSQEILNVSGLSGDQIVFFSLKDPSYTRNNWNFDFYVRKQGATDWIFVGDTHLSCSQTEDGLVGFTLGGTTHSFELKGIRFAPKPEDDPDGDFPVPADDADVSGYPLNGSLSEAGNAHC